MPIPKLQPSALYDLGRRPEPWKNDTQSGRLCAGAIHGGPIGTPEQSVFANVVRQGKWGAFLPVMATRFKHGMR